MMVNPSGKRTVVIAALVVVVIAVAAGTLLLLRDDDASDQQQHTDSHTHAFAPEFDRGTPEEVAGNALRLMYSWNPANDTSAQDALRRAAPLLTGSLLTAATSKDYPTPRPEWASWAAEGVRITAETTVQSTTADGDTVVVQVQVRQRVHTLANNVTPLTPLITEVVTVPGDGGWKAQSYQLV